MSQPHAIAGGTREGGEHLPPLPGRGFPPLPCTLTTLNYYFTNRHITGCLIQ